MQIKEGETDRSIFGIDRDLLAVGLMVFGSSSLTLGFVYANERKFHPSITGTIRGITAFLVCYLVGRLKSIDMTFPSSHNFKWQLIRGSFMVAQGFAYSWSQFYLPLPMVVTIFSTSPIFVALWDYWIFGVLINNRQKGWLMLAFIGVMLIANCTYLESALLGVELKMS